MTEFVFVYMTAPDADVAETIAKTLVEKRLAGCVNIIAGMRSVYRWRGAIESGEELVLIAKTRADHAPRITEIVRDIHPDDTPCVVALPLKSDRSDPGFLDWLKAETGAAAG